MPTSLCTLCFLATWSWSCAQPVPCGSQVSCTLWSCSGLFTGLQLHPGAFYPSLCQLQREWNPELPAQKWSSLVLPRSHPTHARPCTPKGIALAQAKLHTGSTAPAPFHGARRVPVDPLHCAIPRPVSWCMGPPWSRYKLRGGEQRPSPISQCMVSLRPHYTGHTKRSTPSPILGAGGSVPPAPPPAPLHGRSRYPGAVHARVPPRRVPTRPPRPFLKGRLGARGPAAANQKAKRCTRAPRLLHSPANPRAVAPATPFLPRRPVTGGAYRLHGGTRFPIPPHREAPTPRSPPPPDPPRPAGIAQHRARRRRGPRRRESPSAGTS